MLQTEIDKQIQERIFDPTVAEVYSEWKNRSLLEETCSLLSTLPTQVHAPLIYSFTTHVHKEKGLFLDLIGDSFGVGTTPKKALSMSADFLWSISLMVDDIADDDKIRGGRDSCWVKFGKRDTVQAAFVGLNSVLTHLKEITGSDRVVESCKRYIMLGVNSINEHRSMEINTSKGILNRNYQKRCDFHGTFQLAAMSTEIMKNQQIPKAARAITGLRYLNQGGQLINDLKDIAGGDLYNRSFSDIRNGVPTVPISDMFEQLSCRNARLLQKMVGKKDITKEDAALINSLVEESHIVERTVNRIFHTYRQGIDLISLVVDPGQLVWFKKWSEYKLESLDKLLI